MLAGGARRRGAAVAARGAAAAWVAVVAVVTTEASRGVGGGAGDTLAAAVDRGIELAIEKFDAEGAAADAHWHRTPRLRFSTGGIATEDECLAAMTAAADIAVEGRQCIRTHVLFDNDSPYTPRERVVSVRAVHAARLAQDNPGRYQAGLDTLLTLAARMRRRIATQFGVNETLYYHLTEMVCREPREWASQAECEEVGCLPPCMRGCPEGCVGAGAGADKSTADGGEGGADGGSSEGAGVDAASCERWCRDDCVAACRERCGSDVWLSHPLHSDANPGDCDLLDDGVCVRRLPEDITAHLYLNEDFDGGEFFFVDGRGSVDGADGGPDGAGIPEERGSDDGAGWATGSGGAVNKTVVQPTCGRLLAYSSGRENVHGVTGLRQGRRCLVTLWLTNDRAKAEELPLPERSPFLDGRLRGPGRGEK